MNMLLRGRRSHVRSFVEVPASFRDLIGNVIEDLLLILDELDGDADEEGDDPDLEDGGDNEPSLGWARTGLGAMASEDTNDLEEDRADDEDDGTREPSLAAAENHLAGLGPWPEGRGTAGSQLFWGHGNTDEREGDEHDGREASLGWTEWKVEWPCSSWGNDDKDREQDPAESGIGDADGMEEQGVGLGWVE